MGVSGDNVVDWYRPLGDCRLKLLFSNFVYEDSIKSVHAGKEISVVKHSTCLTPSVRNESKTVRRRSFIILMLLISGNVLPNPGPYNASTSVFNVPTDLKSRSGLGFIHINVRSLLPKLDMVRIWVKNTNADVIVLSETWLNKSVPDKAIGIDGHFISDAHSDIIGL